MMMNSYYLHANFSQILFNLNNKNKIGIFLPL